MNKKLKELKAHALGVYLAAQAIQRSQFLGRNKKRQESDKPPADRRVLPFQKRKPEGDPCK